MCEKKVRVQQENRQKLLNVLFMCITNQILLLEGAFTLSPRGIPGGCRGMTSQYGTVTHSNPTQLFSWGIFGEFFVHFWGKKVFFAPEMC